MTKQVKRYWVYGAHGAEDIVDEAPDGEWVRYADIEHLLKPYQEREPPHCSTCACGAVEPDCNETESHNERKGG